MHSNELKFRYGSLNRKLYLFSTSSASDRKIAAKSPDSDLVIEGRKDWFRVKEKAFVIK